MSYTQNQVFERHHRIEHSTMLLHVFILNASATKNFLGTYLITTLLNVKHATGVAAMLLH